MSYARFGEHGSDVYVYEAWDLGLVCCGCDFHTDDTAKFLAHLRLHQRHGSRVTQRTRDLVRARAQWFGKHSLRVLQRIDQCYRMIAAHKASAERMRQADVMACWYRLGTIQVPRNGITKEHKRAVRAYYKATTHVAAAMRYLGAKI